jgi:hypothetical protein
MPQNEVGKLSIKPMAGINLSNFSNAIADVYHMKVGMTGAAYQNVSFKTYRKK